MTAPFFKSYEDMLDYYYWQPLKQSGVDPRVFQKYNRASDIAEEIDLSKSDAPVLTSTTGVKNVLFGATLYSQIVTESNAFALLPKRPWSKSGYRALTAAGLTTGGHITEDGGIPETKKPTFAEITVTPHTVARATNISEMERLLEQKDDTIKWADVVSYTADEFRNTLNRNILADADGAATDGSIITPLDRLISSYSEVAETELTTNEGDVYGLDRDAAASWTDANVSHGGSSGTETDRTLTLSMIDDVIAECEPYWDGGGRKNKAILTGYDTAKRIAQLERPKEVYTPDAYIEFTVNGIKVRGKEAGVPVATFDGIPILRSNNVPKDTISRVYILDLDHISLEMLKPITYVETSDPFIQDKFGTEGVFSWIGEIWCDRFKAQGKIRGLK